MPSLPLYNIFFFGSLFLLSMLFIISLIKNRIRIKESKFWSTLAIYCFLIGIPLFWCFQTQKVVTRFYKLSQINFEFKDYYFLLIIILGMTLPGLFLSFGYLLLFPTYKKGKAIFKINKFWGNILNNAFIFAIVYFIFFTPLLLDHIFMAMLHLLGSYVENNPGFLITLTILGITWAIVYLATPLISTIQESRIKDIIEYVWIAFYVVSICLSGALIAFCVGNFAYISPLIWVTITISIISTCLCYWGLFYLHGALKIKQEEILNSENYYAILYILFLVIFGFTITLIASTSTILIAKQFSNKSIKISQISEDVVFWLSLISSIITVGEFSMRQGKKIFNHNRIHKIIT